MDSCDQICVLGRLVWFQWVIPDGWENQEQERPRWKLWQQLGGQWMLPGQGPAGLQASREDAGSAVPMGRRGGIGGSCVAGMKEAEGNPSEPGALCFQRVLRKATWVLGVSVGQETFCETKGTIFSPLDKVSSLLKLLCCPSKQEPSHPRGSSACHIGRGGRADWTEELSFRERVDFAPATGLRKQTLRSLFLCLSQFEHKSCRIHA